MATKRLPRPRDPIALAKLIGDIATGQVVDRTEVLPLKERKIGARSKPKVKPLAAKAPAKP
jgi:hypothetical protein